jgi:hypothetical protein
MPITKLAEADARQREEAARLLVAAFAHAPSAWKDGVSAAQEVEIRGSHEIWSINESCGCAA